MNVYEIKEVWKMSDVFLVPGNWSTTRDCPAPTGRGRRKRPLHPSPPLPPLRDYVLAWGACAAGYPRRVRHYTVHLEHTASKFNSFEPAASVDNGDSNNTSLDKCRLDHLSSR